MKIVVEIIRINDLGGIVPCIENLVAGMKANGHDVWTYWSGPKTLRRKTGMPPDRRIEDSYRKARTAHAPWESRSDGTGYWFRNSLEWWDMPVIAWSEIADIECDLLIHAVPVPTVSRNTRGHTSWQDMYLFAKAKRQAVYIHDVHYQERYPHLAEMAPAIDAAICVHEAAYFSCLGNLPIHMQFIPNPHDIGWLDRIKILHRPKQLLSIQNFKAWKHVDDLIRAVPHTDPEIDIVVAGGGIEQQYMTAGPDKIKPKYLSPDGTPIWDIAADHNMRYLSYISAEERDEELTNCRCLIDTSWSNLHEKYGCHFNRVFVEAMDAGAVPIVTKSSMKKSQFFKEGKNYLAYDHRMNAEQLGAFINESISDVRTLQRIQDNNEGLITEFAMDKIAERVVTYATEGALKEKEDRKAMGGLFPVSKAIKDRAGKIMEEFSAN